MKLFSRQKNHDHTAVTLRSRLDKSRAAFAQRLGALFTTATTIDDSFFQDLEDSLVSSDVGIDASIAIVQHLREAANDQQLDNASDALKLVSNKMQATLSVPMRPLPDLNTRPYVILVVGVNGVGKTTSIAKLAHRLQDNGLSVMLAAADTFRAAAIEQLQSWGQKLGVSVIAQQHGTDAAAVAHDALTAAQARKIDVLIIDTAGRLHTQTELMEQLNKIERVLKKIDHNCPHEVIQVIDAGTGQNALSQLEHFNKCIAVNSLILTKLDGTARGGVLVALVQQFGIPVRYIGVGESEQDLKDFDPNSFVSALLPETTTV